MRQRDSEIRDYPAATRERPVDSESYRLCNRNSPHTWTRIEDQVIIELKTVERLMPIHEAQILTYLKLSGIWTGLLLNFNSAILKDGMRRIML